MKLSLHALQFITQGQTMKIDITSKLFTLFAAYTLLHAAVYFWYQSKKRARIDAQDFPGSTQTGNAPGRRTGPGIHSSPSRHQMFLLAAMLLAALILTGLVILSPAP
jgi:hypothetical protein